MTRRLLQTRPRRAAAARVLATAALLASACLVHAAPGGRDACVPRPAGGDLASDTPDALSLALTPGKPAGVVDWDARRWQRHRLWITFAVTNTGADVATILPDVAIDLRRDGAASGGQHGLPLVLGPHAGATQRLSFYVPDESQRIAARVLAVSGAPDVRVALSVECSDSRFDAGEMPPPAALLLDAALTRYFGESIDPLSNPRAAFELVQLRASGAQDATDVAWAVRALMQSAADGRGYVRLPGETAPGQPSIVTLEPSLELRADGTAVLRLRGVGPMSDTVATAWAAALHARIRTMQAHHPRAWIVDLRADAAAAAAAWPVLAALSPLLDGPSIGASTTRGGRADWIVERGAVRLAGGAPLVDLQLDPEPAFDGPLAVLLGPGTADGGERVAVAFEGRPHTRFFGTPTAGFPHTGLREETLPDGTVLGIVSERDTDRDGTVYRGPIAPDAVVGGSPSDGEPPGRAIEWLLDEHVGTTSPR